MLVAEMIFNLLICLSLIQGKPGAPGTQGPVGPKGDRGERVSAFLNY